MHPSSQSVCLNMQPYDAKESDETPAPYGYRRTALGYPAEPPKDHVVWSLCTFLFMNICCLGFAAFVFSIKSRDRKVVGDADGATSYGKTAKCLNIISLVLVLVFVVIVIVLFATGMMAGFNQLHTTNVNSIDDWNRYGGK